MILILVISLTVFLAVLVALAVDRQIQMHQDEALIRKLAFIFLLKKLQKAVKQTITFQHVENCEECSGSGAKKGTSATTCSNCGGSGQVRVNQRTPFGVVQTARTCDKCHGKGKIIEHPL